MLSYGVAYPYTLSLTKHVLYTNNPLTLLEVVDFLPLSYYSHSIVSFTF